MWQPDPSDLQRICEMLTSSQLADNTKQKEIYAAIGQYSKNPEFYNYLSYILTRNEIPVSLRRISGLSLKSSLNLNYESVPDTTRNYVKSRLYESFFDNDQVIRKTTTLVMTSLICKGGFQSWPELLDFLQQSLGSQSSETLESALDCISKIIEDLRVNSENFTFFDGSKAGNSVDTLIPRLFIFCDSAYNNRIRGNAIFCLNLSIFSMPPALSSNIKNFMQILVQATTDPDNKIRLRGYQGLISLNETRSDLILEFGEDLLKRVIIGMKDNDYEVARNAISFWPEYLLYDMENKDKANCLKNVLPLLLDALLDCLKYAENDLMNLLPESLNNSKGITRAEGNEDGLEDFETDVDNDEKKDFFAGSGEFTLRRVAGQTLERLAEVLRDEVFVVIQHRINLDIRDQDWKKKEAAILCIGALSEGCYESIKPHLSFILLYLLECLSDQQALIKTISCWTLSKFTSFIVENANEPVVSGDTLIKVYLREIMKGLMENNQQVQEAACTAFSSLISKAAHLLLPYIVDVFQVFNNVFQHYKGNSLFNLYSAVASVFDALESKLKNEQILGILMPTLLKKWNETLPDDKMMCPLMECFVSICNALGNVFIVNYPIIMQKCLKSIENYVISMKNGDKKTEYEKREVFLRSIDLLSSMLDSLKSNFSQLSLNTPLYKLLIECIEDQDFQVRQFIFSFYGEIARECPIDITNYVTAILPNMVNNIYIVPTELDPSQSFISICNNAVWSIGEMIIAFPEITKPFIQNIAERIIKLFTTTKLQRNLAQNFARCLGRMGLVEPNLLSKKADIFAKNWCLVMRSCPEDLAKQQAFRGFFRMVEENNNIFFNFFPYIFDSFALFENPEEDLKIIFKTMLRNYKSLAGEEWVSYYTRLNAQMKDKLKYYEN